MYKHFFLVLTILLIFIPCRSQNAVSYFTDAASYPNLVSNIIGMDVSLEDEKQIMNFMDSWKKNLISDTLKVQTIRVSNQLYERKARPLMFKEFIFFILTLNQNEKKIDNEIRLMQFLEQYAGNRKITLNSINSFIQEMADLYNQNYIHNSGYLKWAFSEKDFTFKIQEGVFSVDFSQGNLTCYAKHDSIHIFETSGSYFPLNNKWIGKGGLVTWERAGFNREEVNVRLVKYSLDLNKVEYTTDSVLFSNTKYFNHPILGILKDKVMEITNPQTASYPEFESFSKRFDLRNLYENVDYDGGFTMKGAKVIGSGNEKEDAIIRIKKGPHILMEVRSKYFVFHPDIVNGIHSVIKISLEKDSIYHSDLDFSYYVKQKEINLNRSESYSSQSPYLDSYHKVDMDFEQLVWKIDQPRIYLTMAKGSSIGNAHFESQNYFKQVQFDKLQGMDAVHPLVSLRKYARISKQEKFLVSDFADYVRFSLNEVRQELMIMAKMGFIYFDEQTDMITIKKKLYTYLNSSTGSIDYDVVDFISTTQAPLENAVLNMETYDLTINGINQIAVSDSQNVIIYPNRDQIILKQNRSFQFDGKVDAGLFSFYGSNFFFNYPDFKVDLQNVDSVSFNVLTGERDNYGKPLIQKVKNVIQHLTGELQVDRADNKSGRKSLIQYPRFASKEDSYVYYQSKDIEHGVYKEDNFYFELYPFLLDSLNNFKKEAMVFKGKFLSAGIFPPLEQELKLQEDYSLGFKYNSGPNGVPVYDGKGKLFADVQMNNNGLHASGKLNFITSSTYSKLFKFYPDSMNTQSDNFTIAQQKGGTEYPEVKSDENYIHWMIPKNGMSIKMGKAPFWTFNDQTNLSGNLYLDTKGLIGSGIMNLTTADIKSRLFHYKSNMIDADTSQFLLKSVLKEGYTVLTEENVNAHIDFNKHIGEFTANEDYTKVQFPENRYISFLNYFKWKMDDKTLEMGAQNKKIKGTHQMEKERFEDTYSFDEEPVGPRYISLKPNQDSLNFVAPKAVYDYQKDVINALDVKLIRVADAIIYPGDGKVTVGEEAQMSPLINAKIVADFKEKYHTIHDATVSILGRKKYLGNGQYDYIDETGRIQSLKMYEVLVDTTMHTLAHAKLLEPDSFLLSPHFQFQGKVTLQAQDSLLTFTGGVTFPLACERPKPNYLKFNSRINPKDVYIPVDETTLNINNNKIFSGILMGSDSIHTYPAFISGRRNYNDSYIMTSSGFLHYNKDSLCYEMASIEKMQYHDSMGNYLSIKPETCREYAEGEYNLGVDLGQVKLDGYGNLHYDLATKELKLDAMMTVDFMMDPHCMWLMGNELDSIQMEPMSINNPIYTRALTEMMGYSDATAYLDEMKIGKVTNFPQEMIHSLTFNELHLRWNQVTKSYQSEGKIGVGNVLNHQINKMYDGYIEVTRRRSGDYMDIYLKLDDKHFYYFGYTRGVMQVLSGNDLIQDYLHRIDLSHRSMKVSSNETGYLFIVSSDSKFQGFMRRYRQKLKADISKDNGQQQEVPDDQGNDQDVNSDNAAKKDTSKPNK